MEFSWLHQLIFFVLFTCYFSSFISSQSALLSYKCQDERGSYTPNSSYATNLHSILSSYIPSITDNNSGFYQLTTGQLTGEIVNAIALCRGDIQPSDCLSCIKHVSIQLTTLCPNHKEAIIWYEECMFRYSNRSIFGSMEIDPVYSTSDRADSVNADIDAVILKKLLDRLRTRAASGGSSVKYASGSEIDPASQTMYVLLQCTPNLSSMDCESCLGQIFERLPGCCAGKEGGKVFVPSCNMRYQRYLFYDLQPHTQQPPSERREESVVKIVLITLSSLTVLLFFLAFCYGLSSYMKRNHEEAKIIVVNPSDEEDIEEIHYISLSTLDMATNGFSNANKLGEGGFGPVYKGTLDDGKEIAIKRLSRTSGQGLTELKNEVTLIARLQHKNLVRVVGCCLENDEKLLVYEYMPNKSLDCILFDSNMSAQLDWQKRLSIINGIARGILYLHEDSRLKIIHRDLKASNILLDHDLNPKIADFGMARLFGANQSEANTNQIVGTYGYMAPEYAMHGLFSVKSDVFSFGVLLLEIIGGRRNNSFNLLEIGETLLTFAWKLWYNREGMKVMDPLLTESCVEAEVLKSIHIGLLCVQKDPAYRPTMSSVVFMLASQTVNLPHPKEPAFSVGRLIPKSIHSTPSDKVCTVNEVTLSSVSPR